MAKRRHVMTPKRLAALKKAQRESALKRKHGKHYAARGSSRRKTIRRNRKIGRRALMAYNGVQLAAGAAAIAYSVHSVHQENRKLQAGRKASQKPHYRNPGSVHPPRHGQVHRPKVGLLMDVPYMGKRRRSRRR